MSEEKVQLFINDQEVTASKGAMLIEVADQFDIDIPRFCYHKNLSVAANCRMCMVEIENAPKPLPACATPVADGMKVYTKSSMALDAQKGTMEFLLINHPLDCPVCDQGGECELQDVAMGYGNDVSRYVERKRVVPDKELGPLVSTDMTRCIHCTRCVRFGTEIAGVRELGATGRGEFMEIGTYVEHSLRSELSGNVIDICPVGALNAKPSRMTARSWEMMQTASIAPHDAVGSNIYLHTLRNNVMRVVPRENVEVNETWISDRDRFSYEGINSSERATQPMLKNEQSWENTNWDECLDSVARKIKQTSSEEIGVLAAPHSTLEELYLLQIIFRQIGVNNIDHRVRQIDFSDQDVQPLFPNLGQSIQSIEDNDANFLIGCDIRLEQPMLAHRMRKAGLRGCKVMSLNPQQVDFYFAHQTNWTLAPQLWVFALSEIASCVADEHYQQLPPELVKIIDGVSVSPDAKQIFETLRDAKQSNIMLGNIAASHPQASVLRALANFIANVTQSNFGIIPQAGNSVGAWLSGVLPHRLAAGEKNIQSGLHAGQMLQQPRKIYVLLNLEPEFDFNNVPQAMYALQEAEFVVLLTPYVTETMLEYANVILPIATFAETEGTYVNAEGRWQSFSNAIHLRDFTQPAWKVLRVLANKLGLDEVQYQTSQQIRDELRTKFTEHIEFDSNLQDFNHTNLVSNQKNNLDKLFRVSNGSIYAVDNVVRRSSSLQETSFAQEPHVAMCEQQARELDVLNEKQVRVVQERQESTLPLLINENLAMHCVWVENSTEHSDSLGESVAPVEIQRIANA